MLFYLISAIKDITENNQYLLMFWPDIFVEIIWLQL